MLVTLVASIAIYRFVDEGSSGDEGYRVYAIFDDVQGLVEKSRVVIAGIPVGIIEKIKLEGDRARVDVRIDQGVKLFKNATVGQRSASLLGEPCWSSVPLEPRASARRRRPDRCRGQGHSTDDIMRSVGEIADSVKKVTAQLSAPLAPIQPQSDVRRADGLTEAIAGVNRTIQANEKVVARTLENVESITADARPKVEDILENVRGISHDINTIIGKNSDASRRASAGWTTPSPRCRSPRTSSKPRCRTSVRSRSAPRAAKAPSAGSPTTRS